MNAKLIRITVGNYKNIAETTIDLRKINALVSLNNGEKSNLLDATRFGFAYAGRAQPDDA